MKKKMFCCFLVCALFLSVGPTSASAFGAEIGLTRQQIRAMPITQRPYRNVFHVYGNTVRAIHKIRNR